MLGLIAGDGHITKTGWMLQMVAHKDDIETLELFKQTLSPNNIITQQGYTGNCWKINICSRSMCEDICKFLNTKPGSKHKIITLPDMNLELSKHFIRGLMDSDGWVKKKGKDNTRSCFYSSTSELILKQVQEFLTKHLEIKSSIKGIKLNMYGKSACKFLSFIYNDAHFYVSRKYNRFKEWILI